MMLMLFASHFECVSPLASQAEVTAKDDYIKWTLFGTKPDTAEKPLRSLQLTDGTWQVSSVLRYGDACDKRYWLIFDAPVAASTTGWASASSPLASTSDSVSVTLSTSQVRMTTYYYCATPGNCTNSGEGWNYGYPEQDKCDMPVGEWCACDAPLLSSPW